MRKFFLEPGILRVFRYYLLFQFVFIVITVLAHHNKGLTLSNARGAVIFAIFGILFQLGYLSWPFLQRTLGRLFLPLGIILSTLYSLIQQNRFLKVYLTGGISTEESAWQIFLFLFIPLILCAWQYNFRAVILYCIFSAFMDYSILLHTRVDAASSVEVYRRLIFIRSVAFLATGYVIAHIMGRFRGQRSSLEEANRNLAHYATTLEELTVSRERNRMARELHDTLAHTLSGIAVQLEAAQTVLPESPEEARPLVARSLEMTRTGLTETRRALENLRASSLDEEGLIAALHSQAAAAAGRAGFELLWEAGGEPPKFPPDVEQSIFRIGQEIIENIVRHAGARHVSVVWEAFPGGLKLTINDDGRGLPPDQEHESNHFGIRGMRERAEMIGAELEISSRLGQGTSFCLTVKG